VKLFRLLLLLFAFHGLATCLKAQPARAESASNAAAYPAPTPWQPDPAEREKLRRSLTLLQSSTPTDRKNVRVLFYGQSITQQAWWKEVERYLRATYTNANLIVENRAIGGHSSQLLVKTAEADLYPFRPDLVIFHVYGSHTDYERIIQNIRQRTSADILLQTDHITRDAALTEVTDATKLSPKDWDAWMNHAFLPQVAAKFDACRADIHELWKAYLRDHKLKASDLLRDGVHLNAHGEWLMAELVKPYLAPLPLKAGDDPLNNEVVRTMPLATADDNSVARFEIEGTRADLVLQPNAKGNVSVLIDGKRPSELTNLYGFTRVSSFPQSDWPMILKVGSAAPLVEEDWTLEITSAAADGSACAFSLRGSKTGPDGEGVSTNRFVSKSGRIVIEPADWNLGYAMKVFKRPLPEKFAVTWKSILHGQDIVSADPGKNGEESVVTIADGLAPGGHVIELRGTELQNSVKALRAYRPKAK